MIADIKDNKRLELSVYPDAEGELAFSLLRNTGGNSGASIVICQDVERHFLDGKS